MERLPEVPTILSVLTSLLWIATWLALAVVAFVRFRSTPSGLLLGGAFLATALTNAASRVFYSWVVPRLAFSQTRYLVASGVQSVLYFALTLLAVAGIALIPRSLRALSR